MTGGLVEGELRLRSPPRSSTRRRSRGHAEVLEDAPCDALVLDDGNEPHRLLAPSADEHVHRVRPLQQNGPAQPTRATRIIGRHDVITPRTDRLSVGCAPAASVVRLRVDLAGLARMSDVARQPLEAQVQTCTAEIERDREKAKGRLAECQAAVKQAADESFTDDAKEVHRVKVARAEQEVRWQEAVVVVFDWRTAVAEAEAELSKAQLLGRAGQNVNVDLFRRQQSRMRDGLTAAVRRSATERTRFETLARTLVEAQERYARAHRGLAPPLMPQPPATP